MKKYLNKMLVISIMAVICMSIIGANEKVSASPSSVPAPFTTTEETEFGSISTYNPVKDFSNYVQVRLDFSEEFLSTNDLENYAGISLTILSTSGQLTSSIINFSSGTTGWKMTERKVVNGSNGDTSPDTNYIILETDDSGLSNGSESVFVVLNIGFASGTGNVGDSTNIKVKDVKVSSSSGKIKECQSTETEKVTATLQYATLTSDSKDILVKGSSIWIKSNDEGEDKISNLDELCSKLKFVNGASNEIETNLDWYFIYGGEKEFGAENETKYNNWKNVTEFSDKKLATGQIKYTKKGEGPDESGKNSWHVFVLGDCSVEKTAESSSLGINISDVTMQRKIAVGYAMNELGDDYERACLISELPSEDIVGNGGLSGWREVIRGKLNIGDIIRTRRRIIDKKWPSQA